MENKLRCHNILITGGGSGIGFAVAKRLLQAGAKVTLMGRTLSKLAQAKADLQSENVFLLQGDVSKTEEIPTYLQQAYDLMGGLDGIVNNAGVGIDQVTGRGWEPWDITKEEWDTVMGINLTGAFFVMRDAVDFMRKHHVRGNILNISSNAACMGIDGSYGASKLSLQKLTRSAAQRFGAEGIIINGIAPGATATPMISSYCEGEDAPYPRHAIGRFIKPQEIAELAYYLMSAFGEIICGHTVVADGGDRNATL